MSLLEVENRASNIQSRAACAFSLIGEGKLEEARAQYKLLTAAIVDLQCAISKREDEIRIAALLNKAYHVSCDSLSGYVAAKSGSKARYVAVKALEAHGVSAAEAFPRTHCARAKLLDKWATTAESRVHGYSEVCKYQEMPT